MTTAIEANFDGLVGPTHNYGGLSFGNLASTHSAGGISYPREAALQGLRKMWALAERGFAQAVLPPQQRPDLAALRRLGFTGSDAQVLARVARDAPGLLPQVCSASAMWTANAATVSPAADTADGRVHFSVANLNSKYHRSLEVAQTGRTLAAVFADPARFAHHGALPECAQFGDEGAANHTRLCADHAAPGVEIFVYGRSAQRGGEAPQHYPARQTLEASQAVARRHGLAPQRTLFALQNPQAIDAGVFHNDVIAVGNQNLLFHHEQAFAEPASLWRQLDAALGEGAWQRIEVASSAVSLQDAVSSYLFNSQLLTLPGGGMLLVLPEECRRNERVWAYLQTLLASAGPIRELLVMDLKQSMNNGGGPACLRLRVVLSPADVAAVAPGVWLTPARYTQLVDWVHRHYREQLSEAELADPQLLAESCYALDELTQLLGLGAIYPFQLT